MTPLIRRAFAALLRWFRPVPTPRRAERRPCVRCGREVAHTQRGAAYVHRCRPDLIDGWSQ